MRALAVVIALSCPAAAQEFVATLDPLSDNDFYRAVACAAPPGGGCRKPMLRWPDAKRMDLTVAFETLSPVLRPYQRMLFDDAMKGALDQINALNAGVRLRLSDQDADIAVHVVGTAPGHIMRNTGVAALDGNLLPLGRVALRARNDEIVEAIIAISAQARRREIASILLEEITQALGLMTDISGPPYRRSVFSEDGNSVVRLEGQDAMAIRRHYGGAPANEEDS